MFYIGRHKTYSTMEVEEYGRTLCRSFSPSIRWLAVDGVCWRCQSATVCRLHRANRLWHCRSYYYCLHHRTTRIIIWNFYALSYQKRHAFAINGSGVLMWAVAAMPASVLMLIHYHCLCYPQHQSLLWARARLHCICTHEYRTHVLIRERHGLLHLHQLSYGRSPNAKVHCTSAHRTCIRWLLNKFPALCFVCLVGPGPGASIQVSHSFLSACLPSFLPCARLYGEWMTHDKFEMGDS